MDKADFEQALKDYVKNSPENYVQKEIALRPDLAGMHIFDEPVFGYASAEDSFFEEAKKPGIIGPHFMAPAEWLHARIEGQAFQNKLCLFSADLLKESGFSALVPMFDSRFTLTSPLTDDKTSQDYYTSNWSERHAAYAAGLGTFGLSKGLISRKGVAGRYISIITGAVFAPDKRPYTGIYDYCIRCGACVRNCPAGAISAEKGKIHYPCSQFLDSTRAKHAPRYGCGKCQIKVPCETAPAAQNY